jgi:hypothetical protein
VQDPPADEREVPYVVEDDDDENEDDIEDEDEEAREEADSVGGEAWFQLV